MNTTLLVQGSTMLVLAALLSLAAAALHVVIFRLQTLSWGSPAAQSVFGRQSPEEVRATRELAANQGFYNLFLGVIAALGALLTLLGTTTVGTSLMLAGTGSMLAAATVLLLRSPAHRAAAVKQGTLPLLAVIAGVLGLAL